MSATKKQHRDDLTPEAFKAAIAEGYLVPLSDQPLSVEVIDEYVRLIHVRYRRDVDEAAKVPKSILMFDMGFLLQSVDTLRATLATIRKKG